MDKLEQQSSRVMKSAEVRAYQAKSNSLFYI